MRVQIGIELSVVLHVLVILHDGRVSPQIMLNGGMVIEETAEVRHVVVHGVTIAHVRIAVVGFLLVHEGVGILPELVANSRVVLEVGLQRRMVLHKASTV